MAEKCTRIIWGTERLARGELDNITLGTDCVELEKMAGSYVYSGSYTAPVMTLVPTNELLISWNADVPAETAIEVQVRVLQGSKWSDWMSMGRWSPYLQCKGTWQHTSEEKPYLKGGHLYIPGDPVKNTQLRAFLYTNNESKSPALRLLSVSARPMPDAEPNPLRPVNKAIKMPAYSQLRRSPAFMGKLSSSTTLAGMMNRFGQDILPEEIAMLSRDWHPEAEGSNSCFAAATAGCYGYGAWTAWMDLRGLQDEIRDGNTVMAKVQYVGTPEEETPDQPWLEGVTGTASGHWLAVCGFAYNDETNETHVLVCDPLSGTDYGAERSYRLEGFLKAFTGQCLLIRKKPRDSGIWAPVRRLGTLMQKEEGVYALTCEGETVPLPQPLPEPAPEPKEGEEALPAPVPTAARIPLESGIVTYVMREDTAFATTAHRRFRSNLEITPEGFVRLPEEQFAKGSHITLYYIDPVGRTIVAEKTV